MHEGWRNVALGEVLDLDIEIVKVASEAKYSLAGVYSFGRGLFEREPLLGVKTRYNVLHRLRPGQLVMSKLKAWEGALAVVPSRFDGFVVSPEFPTFCTSDDLDPSYLSLLCSQDWLWQLLQGQSRGMGGRRERVYPKRFLEVRVPLPPLSEQRRITDFARAIDTMLTAARAEADAAKVLRSAILRTAETLADGLVPLRDYLLKAKAGGTPDRGDPSNFGGDIPWLKSSEVGQDQIKATDEAISERGLLSSSAWLMPPGSIVIAMYGQGATAGSVGFTATTLGGC